MPFNGTHPDGKRKFRPTPGRELRLGKARFGRGTWKLRLQIYGAGPNGSHVYFPAAGLHTVDVW